MGIHGRSTRRHQPASGLASRISARLADIAADGHHLAPGRSWWSWLCAPVPALNRPVQRGLELAFDAGRAIRAAQVTGPFDRSPLSVPSREVYERSTAGTSQVSRRSAETGAAPASWKLVLSVAGGCILQPMFRPGRRGLLPGVVSPKRYPDISRVLVSARGSRGPCVGQTLDPAVIFREPDGLFTGDGGHRNPGASGPVNRPLPLHRPEQFRPNAPPGRAHDRGRCPLYVRAQLETAGLPWIQRDLTAPKATAREAGNPQLTGRFRR